MKHSIEGTELGGIGDNVECPDDWTNTGYTIPIPVYHVECTRFDGGMEFPARPFGDFVNAVSEENAIAIYKELSDEYKEEFAEFQDSSDTWEGTKSFSIFARVVKTLN